MEVGAEGQVGGEMTLHRISGHRELLMAGKAADMKNITQCERLCGVDIID